MLFPNTFKKCTTLHSPRPSFAAFCLLTFETHHYQGPRGINSYEQFDAVIAITMLLLLTLSREFVKAGTPAAETDIN